MPKFVLKWAESIGNHATSIPSKFETYLTVTSVTIAVTFCHIIFSIYFSQSGPLEKRYVICHHISLYTYHYVGMTKI